MVANSVNIRFTVLVGIMKLLSTSFN